MYVRVCSMAFMNAIKFSLLADPMDRKCYMKILRHEPKAGFPNDDQMKPLREEPDEAKRTSMCVRAVAGAKGSKGEEDGS